MSAQTATAPASAAELWKDLTGRLTTPALLKLALGVIWVLALLFFVAVRAGVSEHRLAMKTIGEDSAPSIIAAERIKANLADMHSNAANVLLHKPGKGKQALADYEKRRVEATEGILAAAGNITYGEAERGPLRKLLNELGKYEAVMAQAMVLHQRGDADFLAQHREADRIMSRAILPAADALDKANRKEMDEGYASVRRGSVWAMLSVLASAAALLAVLVLTQLFLYRRMRRVINPGLAGATALAVVFLVYTLAVFVIERRALKTAKEDAFASIHALWRARADAYDANGDESRWLLDRQRAAEYQKAYNAKADKLVKLPPGMTYQALLAAVERNDLPNGFQGYLADELRNITFKGEREAAVASLRTFVRYAEIDDKIRRLEKEGEHDKALKLCLGTKPGESNWAFERFDEALGKTIDINQKEFDAAVKRSFAGLAPFTLLAPLASLGVAGLALAGLWPRLREYAAN
jgi:hypothetical protein